MCISQLSGVVSKSCAQFDRWMPTEMARMFLPNGSADIMQTIFVY